MLYIYLQSCCTLSTYSNVTNMLNLPLDAVEILMLTWIPKHVSLFQCVRYTNHVAFLVNIPVGPLAPGLTPDYVGSVLARSSNFYTFGTRAFYCAFPFLLWLFGPIPMFVSSILLVLLLYHFDTAHGFHTHTSSVAASTETSYSASGSEQPMNVSTQSTPTRPESSGLEVERSSFEHQAAQRITEEGGKGDSSGRVGSAASDENELLACVGRRDSRDHRDMEVHEVIELALKLD